MTLKLITAPAAEPVLLADAKLHLRVDHIADDDLITSLITAAREAAEHLTGRALITQTWERVLGAFPSSDRLELGKPPVASITSITYVDAAGDSTVMDPADYALDDATADAVLLADTVTAWPNTYDTANAVRVRFVAGYGDDGTSVPRAIVAWMLLRIGTLYKLREEVIAGVSVNELPQGYADRLLDPYRSWSP